MTVVQGNRLLLLYVLDNAVKVMIQKKNSTNFGKFLLLTHSYIMNISMVFEAKKVWLAFHLFRYFLIERRSVRYGTKLSFCSRLQPRQINVKSPW